MCGVVAIYSYHPSASEIDRLELRNIRDRMSARGPDGFGEWFSANGRVGLGHRRLTIIDLSEAGHQPMTNEDGTLQLVFNGEIYNYKTLRERLLNKGHIFKSHSDTEVLLHLYEEMGEEMVHELRGMFAFALWDEKIKSLLLARDPYGIKPLYYADDGKTVRVASQVKALLAGGRVSRVPEPAGIAGFYLSGSVPEPFTTFEQIRSVGAGSTLWIRDSGVAEPKRYFSIAEVFHDAASRSQVLNRDELQHTVRDALLDSVRHHLIADVPVSAFLSAGIDSGAVVGLARDAGMTGLQTITLAFAEYESTDDDESLLSREVADLYGTTHTRRALTEEEFHADLPKILAAMDQPSIDGLNTYFVSKAAAECGIKVALSGLGGDELFGGYPSFRDLPRWVNRMWVPAHVPGMGRLVRSVITPFIPRGISPKIAGMLEYGGSYPGAYLLRRGLFMPWELPSLIGERMAREGLERLNPLRQIGAVLQPDPGGDFGRVATLEASLYMRNQLLRDADWASMAHSLEVRVPLVDVELLRALSPLLVSNSGLNTKESLALSPSVPLPHEVRDRSKTGFSIPVGKWLEQDNGLDVWRRIPELARPGIHWARRWAYTTASLGVTLAS
jgi:asparagine synthase (glutamine-hydrolysing)